MVKDNAIELFLDDLASRKPTPSGGSAAAVMGAMGAALVSMVCNLTIGKMQYREYEQDLKSVLTKAEALRRDLTKMIEEDLQPSSYTRWFCCMNKTCKTTLVMPARYKIM